MTFSNKPWCRRVAAVVVVLTATACGGGTQVNPFHPDRMVSFGDQSSAIESNGLKYTVNYADAGTGAIDCKQNPNWVQVMSNGYGFSFDQCHDDDQVPESKLYAANGAKVADVVAQVDTHLATDLFNDSDLVTISAGLNDVLEQYQAYSDDPDAGTDAVVAELQARGERLAELVTSISDAGAKVVVVRAYGLEKSPFGRAEKEAHQDDDAASGRPDRVAVLKLLSSKFNLALLSHMPDDGTKIATVDGIATIKAMADKPTNFGLKNVEEALCLPEIVAPACRTREQDLQDIDLSDDGTTWPSPNTWNRWLWSDSTNLSPRAHARLGQLAYSRARNNPFSR